MNRALMTATQVCQELNISRPTLYKRVNEGIIKCVRYGRDYRFNSNHIEDLKEGVSWEYTKETKKGRPIGRCVSKSIVPSLDKVLGHKAK